MAASDEIGTSRKSWEDKEYGGNLSALIAYQGVSDCGFLSAETER